jgi:alpha-1,2-mannosyltransferase
VTAIPDRTPAARVPRWLLVALVVVAGAIPYLFVRHEFFPDFLVYRAGGRAWLHHIALYGPDFPVRTQTPWGLAFTYPPIAAVLFAAFSFMPVKVGTVLVFALSSAAFIGSAWIFARYGVPRPMPRLLFPFAVGAALVLEPILINFHMGQVNTILILLITADCLVPWKRWPRGILLGVAAAIKLTPLVFLLFFFVRRDWRALITAVASFTAVCLAGFVAAPRDSTEYWLHTLRSSARIGTLTDSWNQSINGVLLRLDVVHERRIWAAAALVMIVLATVALWRTRRKEDIGQAVLLTAALQVLISPVSWSHHWDWAGLFLIWCVSRSWHRRSVIEDLIFAGVVAAFWIGPHWAVPYHERVELHWTWWQRVIGEGYVLLAILFIVASALGWGPDRHREPARDDDRTTGTDRDQPAAQPATVG